MDRIFKIPVLLALFAGLAFGQASAPSPSVPVDQENSRKAKALLGEVIQALGGQAYLACQEKTEEGRYYTFFHGVSNSAGLPFARHTKFPDKDRLEIIHVHDLQILPGQLSIPDLKNKKKSDVVLIHNGDKGYETTYKGTAAEEAELTTAYIRRRKHSLEWVLRKWINEPGVALFYDGPTVAMQKPAEKITIINAQNDTVTLFLDATTHLPIETSYSWRDPSDKERNTEEEVYDNYKPVQGIMAPHSVTRYLNGDMSYQKFLNTVSINRDMPDSMFEATVTYDPMKPQPRR